MVVANDYFMKKMAGCRKSNCHRKTQAKQYMTRGVYYEGLMALYKIAPKSEYLEYAINWGEYHKWNMRNGIRTRNADDQCCGQTYIDLYLIDKKT